VVHSTALSISDNLPSYPPDNHHSSDGVYRRAGGWAKALWRSTNVLLLLLWIRNHIAACTLTRWQHCVKWHNGHHLTGVTSNQKSTTVRRHIFIWRTG